MIVLAVDPGTTHSAWVLLVGESVVMGHDFEENEALATRLEDGPFGLCHFDAIVFEKIEAMGMAVGAETFETVFWTGRFFQIASKLCTCVDRLPRRAVKLHLCGSMKAKDANIRQALIDRFGGSAAIGKKATPGPLYGLRAHEFAALAVAVTWADTHS